VTFPPLPQPVKARTRFSDPRLPRGTQSWVDLYSWLAIIPRWCTRPKTVAHPRINRAERWATWFYVKPPKYKCNIQRISNRDGVNITVCSTKYKIGAHVLHWSDETRDLGVIVDKKLNFNSHVSAVAHIRASLILRTFRTRDPVVLTQAFITYVRPLLKYTTCIWLLPVRFGDGAKITVCCDLVGRRVAGEAAVVCWGRPCDNQW